MERMCLWGSRKYEEVKTHVLVSLLPQCVPSILCVTRFSPQLVPADFAVVNGASIIYSIVGIEFDHRMIVPMLSLVFYGGVFWTFSGFDFILVVRGHAIRVCMHECMLV